MPTTVQVSEKTLQMLNELKKEIGARSHNEAIRMLISETKKIPRSMFGSNPNLRPFSVITDLIGTILGVFLTSKG